MGAYEDYEQRNNGPHDMGFVDPPEPLSTDEMLAAIERQRILAECFGPLTITEYQGRHTAVIHDTDIDRDLVWEGATRREAIERVYAEFA